ncbi:MAG: hypothetical protein A3C10_01800 [Candidatus Magasanikbacteria bacterium RIFCSPHIGHO2_02_FULL_48_18]|nr:MAG: hypothetical protein A3I74_01425 [Candidatus Magasanikbacteria bacterium RIFCSPLOWO2_02_FULL_47_16]OGH79900.1 MAG: hypothetical protein A3C10_01800 [Candidatus Magasanikbacteria bacterium RIFCSPHIGHO2_02_FULL_48_18]
MIDPKDRKYMLLGLRIAGDFGATIAVPVVIFVIIGQWLDGRYGHRYFFTAFGFLVSAVISGIIITRKAKQYGKEYQAMDTRSKKEELKKE